MNRINKMILISLLLGFGLGIITTSILNLLFPVVKYKNYSEQEIIEMAKKFGMIKTEDYVPIFDESDTSKNLTYEETEDNIEGTEETIKEDKDYYIFEIKKGEVSEIIIENLFNEDIIKDKDKFLDVVTEKNAEKKFKYGTYHIEKGIDYDELLNILCGKED